MSAHPSILVVDDHRKVREPLALYLRRHDFNVMTAGDAAQMWSMLAHTTFDAIVLDVGLPDGNGFDLCQTLHRRMNVPVILLTALGEPADRVRGLDLGADDYVVKPFEPRELVARIHSVLRRRGVQQDRQVDVTPAAVPPAADVRYVFAGWAYDAGANVLSRPDGSRVKLSTAEGRLLHVFLMHPHTVLARDRLIDLVTRPGAEVYDRSIDRQVSRLRLKLTDPTRDTDLLRTVWGDGYVLSADVTCAGF
ncbi:response regulator transcription factor [Alcaligenaceae bacterium C4P045]|nr:response regulator transcription factor [Alcaligenaceae bacterium C4P045]